jgi:hypothetical protein
MRGCDCHTKRIDMGEAHSRCLQPSAQGISPLDYVWDSSPAMDRPPACCFYIGTSSHSSTKTRQHSAQTAASPYTRGDQSTCA